MGTLRELNRDLYNSILNDTRDANPRFFAMRKAYLQMADIDLDNHEALEANAAKLSRLNDFVNLYLENHGGLHGSRKGRERYSWATQLRNITRDLSVSKTSQLYGEVGENKQFYQRAVQAYPDEMKYLEKLGKLQKNIGAADFVPKTMDFQLEPSLWQRFKAAVGRGVGHLLNGIGTLTTGLVTLLPTALATVFTEGKYEDMAVSQESDMLRVPGTQTGERFEELHPENGPDNQAVYGDVRRVPINYEEEIPEDPNQPPTMTLCFEQGDEGGTNALGKDGDQGHCFVSLKYTRNNPLTGQPERYKCTFGFYPHQNIDSSSLMAAMGTTGLILPGSLENDSDHSYSTSKTFTVNNKTINTVMKNAELYSKGGYNYLTRSCATFAHDMAVIAGLPADQFFAKTDLTGIKANGMKAMSFLASYTISRLGEHRLIKHAEKRIGRYERFGQRIVNREDLQRMLHQDPNSRLKAYVPSVAAEAARSDWDFHLDSTRYTPDIPEEKDGQEYSPWELGNARMMKEQMNLLNSVEKFLRKNNVPADQIRTLTDNLTAFMATNDRIIEAYGKKAFPDDYNWNEGEKPTLDQSLAASREATKAMKEYIEGLDHIFRTTFKSDPRLNISFQHMVSTIRNMSDDFAANYRDMKTKAPVKGTKRDLYHEEGARNLFDFRRDDFLPLARLRCSVAKFSSNRVNHGSHDSRLVADIAGTILTFGSLEEFLRREKEVDDAKTRYGETSKKYTELSSNLEIDKATVTNFRRALKAMETKTQFTIHDIDFAFRQLPAGMKNAGLSNSDANPAAVYQSLILARSMPGLRNVCETGILEAKRSFLQKSAVLEGIKDMVSPKEYAKKFGALQYETKNTIARTIMEHVAEKLENCPLLDSMLEGLKASKYVEEGIDPATATEEQKADVENMAFGAFTDVLCGELIKPMVEDVNLRLDGDVRGNVKQENDFFNVVNKSLNSERLYANAGATRLMNLLRAKFVQDAIPPAEQIKELQKNEKLGYSNICLEAVKAQKKDNDLAKLQAMGNNMSEKLATLSRSGKAGPDNPQAMELLGQSVTCGMLRSSITSKGKGLEEHVTDKLLATEAYRMAEYGVFDFMKTPEQRETVQQALNGDLDAKNRLVSKAISEARKVSPARKKTVDTNIRAREMKNDDKAVKQEEVKENLDIRRPFSI